MNIKKYIVIATLALIAFPAFAQEPEKDLQKAIVVEKDFVPVETKAVKPATTPAEAPVQIQQTNLTYSDWTVPAQFETKLVPQSPIQYSGGQKFYKKPGYFNFGMGNFLNAVGSVGYRFVDTEKTKFGAWLQHNSTKGSVNPDGMPDVRQFVVEERVGLNFSNQFSKGSLSAGLVYHFDKFNYYGAVNDLLGDEKQTVNDVAVQLMWQNVPDESNSLNYHIGMEYDYLAMDKGLANGFDGTKYSFEKGVVENRLKAQIGAEIVLDDLAYVGLNADFNYMAYDNPYYWDGEHFQPMADDKSFSMLSLNPYYSKRTDRMNLKIGAMVDLSFSRGQFFRIAPDVHMDWAISRKVGLFIKATGGNHINTFRETTFRNRYVNPSLLLPLTHTIVDAEIGMNLGRFRGLSVSPFVGFVASRNAMLPYMALDISEGQIDGLNSVKYDAVDMNGWKAGVNISYIYDEKVQFDARYVFTPQEEPETVPHDDSGIVSDDRAEHCFESRLKVTPIEKLDIRLSYELRTGRFAKTLLKDPVLDIEMVQASKMANVSNLNLGASYRVNDWLTANVDFGNLLNRRYEIYKNIYAQRFNLLAGVSLKF